MITAITSLDLNILRFIHDHLHFPVLNEFMCFITHLADPIVAPIYPVIFLCIGFFIWFKRKKAGTLGEIGEGKKFDFVRLGMLVAVALIFGLIVCNLTLKPLIARDRPYTVAGFEDLIMIELQSEKSFPSGHSVAVFEMAFAVAYATRDKGRRKWGVIAYICAVTIAYSRLYVGVHYPSDVICGALIGTVCGILAVIVVTKVYSKFIEPRLYKKQ
ncbi:MAG: phosphatase PAP2 family protein [Clostridia bacterium]|nr:phosphatase PAP2 family protein [Clostridia bacterium]